jgi:hypothetical protein
MDDSTSLAPPSSVCSSARLPDRIGVLWSIAPASTSWCRSGIRTLLLGAKTVQRRGGGLVLMNPVEEVERVLEVMGVTDLMPIYRDSEAALAAASAAA